VKYVDYDISTVAKMMRPSPGKARQVNGSNKGKKGFRQLQAKPLRPLSEEEAVQTACSGPV